MIHKKLLSLLVLLMTAASGAWAQTQITQDFEDGLGDWTMNNCHEYTGINDYYGGYEGSNSYSFLFYFSTNVPQYLISPELDENDGGTMSFYYARFHSGYPETFKVGYSTTTNVPTAFTWGNEQTVLNKYDSDGYLEYTYDFPAGTKYVSIAYTSVNQYYLFVDAIKIEYTAEAPTDVEVTTNKAEGETTFTEATFTMPTFDATVNYELVRDMEIAVNAVMPANIRLQKKQQGGGYEPIDATKMIPEVKDAIDGESQAVTMTKVTEQTAETGDYTLQLQKKVDDEWTSVSPDVLGPGTYRYEVTGANLYDGVCYTNEFKLFEGYPVTIPAGEYVTYYSDENLTVDAESGAQLYTITAVSGNIAIATEIPIANAGMPFLIFNSTDEPQTFMLIPTENEINQTFAREFVGTTTATTIAASTTEQSNYAFNGKQFVIVRTALSVAANKAWLEVKNTNARAINIVLDETTGVNEVNEVNEVSDDTLYDLNGRKVQKPARKGVYVKNGQKVIR